MVVAQEMENPVDQQACHLLLKTLFSLRRLFFRLLDGDHHIPQDLRAYRKALP